MALLKLENLHVALEDGTEITARVVVSACNPHDTFLRWLRNPPRTVTVPETVTVHGGPSGTRG